MGLDMYLYKRTYVQNWSHFKKPDIFDIKIKKGNKEYTQIKPERIAYIIELVCEWTKFYALHEWFVKNVQGGKDECQESPVPEEVLKNLLDILKKIEKNNSLGDKLLPRSMSKDEAFNDDNSYLGDIEETIKILDKVLKEENKDEVEYFYHSSW